MGFDRRRFIKVAAVGSALCHLGLSISESRAYAGTTRIKQGTEVTSICPFCGVGCGVISKVSAGRITGVEGDQSHPISRGALCPKGTALFQVANSDRRLGTVLYRRPGSTSWEKRSWGWAIKKIAANIKKTRDETFVPADSRNRPVNRCEGIACLGGTTLTNEECYAFTKLSRALGVLNLDHHGLRSPSASADELASSYGLGTLTQPWNDVRNSACLLIIGSDVAKSHPVAMKWIAGARELGAKLIVIDSQSTQTSAVADLYSPIRSGAEIAFIGALINYALKNDLVHYEYLKAHTSASFLVDPEFEFADGVFGEITDGRYTKAHWGFQRDRFGRIERDPGLADPNCVFQRLKKHFARYTPEKASQVTGMPAAKIRDIAKLFCATHKPDSAAAIMYAAGSSQLNSRAQATHSYLILQQLLGNLSVAGGGVYPLYDGAGVQSPLDHGLAFESLPGYLRCPSAGDASLQSCFDECAPGTGDSLSSDWWANYPKFAVSLLKAYWGDYAGPENDFAYHCLPKRGTEHPQLSLFEAMQAGRIKGLIAVGQNPVAEPVAQLEREALDKLEWMVVTDIWVPAEITGLNSQTPLQLAALEGNSIQAEIILLPAAAAMEREGSLTNASRWCQWCNPAVNPPGDAKSGLAILTELQQQLKRLYAAGGVFPEPVIHLSWEHGSDAQQVARDINGCFTQDVVLPNQALSFRKGDLVPSFSYLRDDGSTSAGNWLYCGSYANAGNMMARREASQAEDDPLGLNPNWSWSWPSNQRILYNHASCDASGMPWNARNPVLSFNSSTGIWSGDVPDAATPPRGKDDSAAASGGDSPSALPTAGRAGLFAPGLADGPFPEHYEPSGSPIVNAVSKQQNNPVTQHGGRGQLGNAGMYPIVATNRGPMEDWQEARQIRSLPWLAELAQKPCIELSEELARERGIKQGDLVTVTTAGAPGGFALRALVTKRLKPHELAGQQVHEVGLYWPTGSAGHAFSTSAIGPASTAGQACGMLSPHSVFHCNVHREGQR